MIAGAASTTCGGTVTATMGGSNLHGRHGRLKPRRRRGPCDLDR